MFSSLLSAHMQSQYDNSHHRHTIGVQGGLTTANSVHGGLTTPQQCTKLPLVLPSSSECKIHHPPVPTPSTGWTSR